MVCLPGSSTCWYRLEPANLDRPAGRTPTSTMCQAACQFRLAYRDSTSSTPTAAGACTRRSTGLPSLPRKVDRLK